MTDPDTGLDRVAWDWLPERWTREPRYYDRTLWCRTPEMEAAGVPAEYARVCAGLDELLAGHGYDREGELYRAVRPNRDTLALFCHLGVECVLLAHLIGASPMVLWHGLCPRTSSVTTVITEERRQGIASFRINAMGDTSHLWAAGAAPSFAARFCETWDSDERHD
jgi:probable phosphoglycerate mutase